MSFPIGWLPDPTTERSEGKLRRYHLGAEIARAQQPYDLARSEAHARLGELYQARARLIVALAKREQLTHPGFPDTRSEHGRLGGQPPTERTLLARRATRSGQAGPDRSRTAC